MRGQSTGVSVVKQSSGALESRASQVENELTYEDILTDFKKRDTNPYLESEPSDPKEFISESFKIHSFNSVRES